VRQSDAAAVLDCSQCFCACCNRKANAPSQPKQRKTKSKKHKSPDPPATPIKAKSPVAPDPTPIGRRNLEHALARTEGENPNETDAVVEKDKLQHHQISVTIHNFVKLFLFPRKKFFGPSKGFGSFRAQPQCGSAVHQMLSHEWTRRGVVLEPLAQTGGTKSQRASQSVSDSPVGS